MKRILMIEDDPWLSDSYGRVLGEKWQITTAADASLAMRAIEGEVFDAVVADIMLEGHTILALLHELQSYDDTRKLPIVLCSALDNDELVKFDWAAYGVRAVLDKTTLTPEKLRAAVGEVL